MDWSIRGFKKTIANMVAPVAADETRFGLNDKNDAFVAHGASAYEEIVAAGRAFQCNTGMTTALDVAAVIAYPTTAVLCAMYNGEPDGGRSYVIDRAFATCTAAGAALEQSTLIACLGTVRETAPTDATPAGALRALNGMGGTDTKMRWIVAGTALPATTGVAANWFPLATSAVTAVVSLPGHSIVADCNGRYVVPPGRYFALHVLSASVGAIFNAGIEWHERQFRELG